MFAVVVDDATLACGPGPALVGHAAIDGQFLADLCHHVRTPLHGILGSLELLLDAELPDDARELARTAFQSAIDLHHLFEENVTAAQR